jgi:hypothetical protein
MISCSLYAGYMHYSFMEKMRLSFIKVICYIEVHIKAGFPVSTLAHTTCVWKKTPSSGTLNNQNLGKPINLKSLEERNT